MLEAYIDIAGITIATIGKLLIAWTAIAVHRRMIEEQRMDKRVFEEMLHERKIAFVGITCLIIGWGFEVLPQIWNILGI